MTCWRAKKTNQPGGKGPGHSLTQGMTNRRPVARCNGAPAFRGDRLFPGVSDNLDELLEHDVAVSVYVGRLKHGIAAVDEFQRGDP